MAIKQVGQGVPKYIGASTDTKPTQAAPQTGAPPQIGSTFLEHDTGLLYITYDGTNWVIKDQVVRAEDGAHTSGDTGIMGLGVRNDTPASLAGTDGDYAPSQFDSLGNLRTVRESNPPMFGEPTLAAANNSCASWARGMVSPLDQKSATGWLANLYGGVQTGDDWARINIPVNELKLTELASALWSYYMTGTETMGVNMVIWVHDPTDFDKRAEITQLANVAGLEKAAGWNAHELNTATDQFFFYGEGTTGTALSAGPANLYGLDDFQADTLFSTWSVYRITFEYGWDASGTFDDVWVADIKLNGQMIPLKPDSQGTGRIAFRSLDTATTLALTVAPKTPFRLLTLDVHASAVLDTGETLTLTKDAGKGTSFDTVILSEDLFIGSRTSYFAAFGEGYDFEADDEIDAAQANGSSDTIGMVIRYQTVFA